MIALIFIFLLTAPAFFCERVELRSPRYTNFGNWHPWSRCRDGEFAYGIQVKVEGDQRGGDDTGLNAVCLFCRPLGSGELNIKIIKFFFNDIFSDEISRENWINSGEGLWGVWGARKYCQNTNVLIGFELRSEPDQRGKDDVAADNFAGYCGEPLGPRTKDVWVAGDTPGWGEWTGAQLCPERYAVCGIQSQIEGDQRGGDDTALNNVNVECCKITVAACNPGYSLVRIAHYDNSQSLLIIVVLW